MFHIVIHVYVNTKFNVKPLTFVINLSIRNLHFSKQTVSSSTSHQKLIINKLVK